MTSQLLNPPAPPTLHEPACLLLASKSIAYQLNNKVGNTR